MGWIIFIIGTIGWHAGMYGMFKKAGIEPWKALIPFYNTWCIVEICKINKAWFWLQLIPIAGQFITIWITIIFVMHFGKFTVIDHTLTVFLPFIYFLYLGYSEKERWKGESVVKLYRKPASREWIDAAVFAVVAATLIRSFIFEAYVIPTGSMEKTLLINDFLFVNKLSFGPRIPQTPLSFPFVHNTLPGSETTPSYLKWLQLPYKRLPGFSEVKRGDVVVFNFPAGDTIINEPGFGSLTLYYDVLRDQYKGNRDALKADHDVLVHPMDKTDNYIKRCVAEGGDTLQIVDAKLYINGKLMAVPPNAQTDYLVSTNGQTFTDEFLNDTLQLRTDDPDESNIEFKQIQPGLYYFNMRAADADKVRKNPIVTKVEPYIVNQPMELFPFFDTAKHWSIDNFGPVWVPKKGTTVQLTKDNIDFYKRIIDTYEHNNFEESNGKFIINGKETSSYTFKYNYYWMMGDNRHKSQDSRFWGFVPETHIVGRASLIWFSWNHGPRWDRLFRTIK